MRCKYCGLMDCDCMPETDIEAVLRKIIAEEIAEQLFDPETLVLSRKQLRNLYHEILHHQHPNFEQLWKDLKGGKE